MGGYFPGPLGFAAFVGVKFGGYALAGLALKKLQPTITASAVKIAATRTGLGILLGPPMTLFGAFLVSLLLSDRTSDVPFYGAYGTPSACADSCLGFGRIYFCKAVGDFPTSIVGFRRCRSGVVVHVGLARL